MKRFSLLFNFATGTATMTKILFPACALGAATLLAGAYNHDIHTAEECRVRDGLPNVFAKLKGGQEVRIAYLGGSITAANGWRPNPSPGLRPNIPRLGSSKSIRPSQAPVRITARADWGAMCWRTRPIWSSSSAA